MKQFFHPLFIAILFFLLPVNGYAALDFGPLKANSSGIIAIYVEDPASVPVSFGGTAKLVAKTYPEDMSVEWSVEPESSETGIPAKATISNSGLLYADSNSGSGWVRVTASTPDGAKRQARVSIGCLTCSGEACDVAAGSGFVDLGSINLRISLGKAEQGMAAGDLLLYSKEPTVDLASPAALELSTLSENVKGVYKNGVLRQVSTPQALVDIVTFGSTAYEILFYRKSVAITIEDGLQKPDPMAVPITLWRIESPDPVDSVKSHLIVTQLKSGKSTTYQYGYDEDLLEWSLSSGNGLKTKTKTEKKTSDGDRIVRTTIRGEDGTIASVIEQRFREFPWGEALIRETTDPDGAALQTIINYYEDEGPGYSRIASRINQDGSWVRYIYDDKDRIVRSVTPWLDGGPDSPEKESRVTVNDYTPLSGDTRAERDLYKPRTVTEYIQGVQTGRTYYLYSKNRNDERVEVRERCSRQNCNFGDEDNLRRVTTYYPRTEDHYRAGKLKSTVTPDGQLTSYVYETGIFTPDDDPAKAVFTPGEGKAIRTTILHGTANHPNGVPFKTLKERSVADWLGNRVLEEKLVTLENGESERISWTFKSYNELGRLIETLHSNGTRSEQSWSCCGRSSATDTNGITVSYAYDDLKRLTTKINEATGLITEYGYDGAGQRLFEIKNSDGQTLSNFSRYDRAGRLLKTTDAAGLVTRYIHDGTTTRVVRPGGGEEITSRHLDGSIQAVTGSAMVARYYSYGVNSNGSQYTLVHIASEDSPRYEKTTRDLLGRIVQVEKPGYSKVEVRKTRYNALGQMMAVSQPDAVDTLYEYDELGNRFRSGLDLNGNGKLDTASMDRISEQQNRYVKIDGDWWQEQRGLVYIGENSAEKTTTGITRNRLSGWDGKVVSETVTIDIHGNSTISRELLNRYKHQKVRLVNHPDSDIIEEQLYQDNRLTFSRSKTGILTKYRYDGFGRRIATVDPRTGISTREYGPGGRVTSVTDAAGNITSFEYDPVSGQKIAEINALNKGTHFAYNTRGQLIRSWGEVPYPISSVYNKYGEMIAMQTYRRDHGWNGEKWPDDAEGDTTRWQYQEATGLLLSKVDAEGNGVTYSYLSGGKLYKRTWARGVETIYSYMPSGALAAIDYSDTTPDISFSYDRLGRKTSVTDAMGTRDFTYSPASLQLIQEHIPGANPTTLTISYDKMGRASGLSLGSGYSVKYTYDSHGHFRNLFWRVAGKNDTVNYSYLENSDLLAGYETEKDFSTQYQYAPFRNLKTAVINMATDKLISRYEYQYDILGRRINVRNSGRAFSDPAFSLYGYNDRDELQSSMRYLGNDLQDQTRQVDNEKRLYTYDPIGNRVATVEAKIRQEYVTNSLNQYEIVSGKAKQKLVYDLDGNLIKLKKHSATTRYIYNGENRLIAREPATPNAGDTRSVFAYDYKGRRISKKLYRYDASGTPQLKKNISFIYDGWNLISEVDHLTHSKTNYIWGLDLSRSLRGAGGIGGLLARVAGNGTTHSYFYDGNGNVGQLVGLQGIAAAYDYDAFGNVVKSKSVYALNNPFRFSTKYLDEENRLYYYGYRYYSAELGRWVSKDPLGEEGGLNLYGFAGNDGINKWDKLGLTSHNIKVINSSSYNGLSRSLKREYVSFFTGVAIKAPTVFDALPGLYPVEFNFFYEYGTDNYYNICRFKETGMSGFAELWHNFKDFAAKRATIRYAEGLLEYVEFLYSWDGPPSLKEFKTLYDFSQLEHKAIETETVQLMTKTSLINEDTFQNLFGHSTTYYINMIN